MSNSNPTDIESRISGSQLHIDDQEVVDEGSSSIVASNFPVGAQKPWWKKLWTFGRRKQDPTREQLENGRYRADTRNRNLYALALLAILVIQLIAAHYVIYRAAVGPHDPAKNGFYLSDQVLMAYMGSVVVEVIGLVYGIVRGIFPSNDQ